MNLRVAEEQDFDEIVDLANLAYRGREGAPASWNIESGLMGGPRLDRPLLEEELGAKPESALLVWREREDGPLLGTAWLEPQADGVWYLGLLTVTPERQNQGSGRALLRAAEEWAAHRGARLIRMTVLSARTGLVAWYERRGYRQTGERIPVPPDHFRFGRPLRGGLEFAVMEREL